jgi:hypothetical protein
LKISKGFSNLCLPIISAKLAHRPLLMITTLDAGMEETFLALLSMLDAIRAFTNFPFKDVFLKEVRTHKAAVATLTMLTRRQQLEEGLWVVR